MFLTATEQNAAMALSKAGYDKSEDIVKTLILAGFRLEGRPQEPVQYPTPKIDRELVERMGQSMDGPWPRS